MPPKRKAPNTTNNTTNSKRTKKSPSALNAVLRVLSNRVTSKPSSDPTKSANAQLFARLATASKATAKNYNANLKGMKNASNATKVLRAPATRYNVGAVRAALARGADPNVRSPSGGSSMVKAYADGHREVALLLLNAGANPDTPGLRIDGNRTLLRLAVFENDIEMVKMVLARSTRTIDTRIGQEATPLIVATVRNYADIVRLLLDAGANPNLPHYTNVYPIHSAIRRQNIDLVEMLLDKGAAVNPPGNRTGVLAVALRAASISEPIIRLLLRRGADVNAMDYSFAPLHYAARNNYIDHVRTLLRVGADPNILDSDGFSPLHYAAVLNRIDIVRVLLNAGASGLGHTSLHEVISKGYFDIARLLIRFTPEIATNKTVLWYALSTMNVPVSLVHDILRAGANVNARYRDANTPLHIAVSICKPAIVDLFLKFHANVNVRNRLQQTPLFIGVTANCESIVGKLIRAGANPNIPDKNGVTPLRWAITYKHRSMAHRLLLRGASLTPNSR